MIENTTEQERLNAYSDMEVVKNIMEVLNYMGFSSVDELLNDYNYSLRRYLSRLPELYNTECVDVGTEQPKNPFMNRKICNKKPETSVIPEIINPILNRKYRGLE